MVRRVWTPKVRKWGQVLILAIFHCSDPAAELQHHKLLLQFTVESNVHVKPRLILQALPAHSAASDPRSGFISKLPILKQIEETSAKTNNRENILALPAQSAASDFESGFWSKLPVLKLIEETSRPIKTTVRTSWPYLLNLLLQILNPASDPSCQFLSWLKRSRVQKKQAWELPGPTCSIFCFRFLLWLFCWVASCFACVHKYITMHRLWWAASCSARSWDVKRRNSPTFCAEEAASIRLSPAFERTKQAEKRCRRRRPLSTYGSTQK